MNKSRVALVALIAAAVVAIGVSVVGFTASGIARIDKKSAHTAQLADKSKATTVRTQIERPLSLSKGEVKNIEQLSDAPDHIALKWDEVKGARKYNIYLCDKDSTNAFTKVAAVEDPTVDIPGALWSAASIILPIPLRSPWAPRAGTWSWKRNTALPSSPTTA